MQVENILFDFNQIICYNIIGGDIFNTAKAYVKFFYFLFCQLDKNFFLILLDKVAHMGRGACFSGVWARIWNR